ncbi:MAG: PBP1A family penicillin-binding protein [Desulfotomaculaceae bacterium]|nr:PBP1A family penicillin-binding protein [Desulfotomaculaceae bacterium]
MIKKWPKVLKVTVISILVLIFLTLSISISGYFYGNRVFSALSGEKSVTALFDQNSFIYSQNGTLVKEIHGEINRIPVLVEKIPKHVQQAFVAIEDERFYKHHGVDPKAIIRALYNYYKEGQLTEGASTITQQTMKMYFLTPEQSLWRKIKEAILAVEFERRYSKDKVLELYLNRAYFGEGAYGIQTASKVYFNKESSGLTIAEGALLAALVQAPSFFDPYINPDFATQRRNIVIEKLIKQGYISGDQVEEALLAPLNLKDGRDIEINHSYFTDYIIDEAISVVGEEKLLKGGLKIYSTMEPEIQNIAEKVFEQSYLFPSAKVEAAVALLENGTGEIKALVGGRKYVTRHGFNRATQLSRQPGSAFKPVAVYAPAFEAGYSPESIVSDTPFKVGNYEPHNSGGDFYGQISIRTAVQWSRNVAAVRLLNQIGVDKGYEMAGKLGFNLAEDDRCLPLALGGLTRGVSPLQMAGAYAAFANQGVYIEPHAIKYIEDPEGQIIYTHPEGTAVMNVSTADAIKDVLRAAVQSGTGYRAGIRGTEVAGKTGTTELPATPVFSGLSGNKDAWFVGFTSRYTAAVWMGYDEKDMDRHHYLTSYGGNQPADIFRTTMAGAMGLSAEPPVRTQDVRVQEEEKKQDDPGKQVDTQRKEKQEPKNDDNHYQEQLKEQEKKTPGSTEKPQGEPKEQDTPKVVPLEPEKQENNVGQKI